MSECSNCDVLRSQKRELNAEIGRLSAENVILKDCAGYKISTEAVTNKNSLFKKKTIGRCEVCDEWSEELTSVSGISNAKWLCAKHQNKEIKTETTGMVGWTIIKDNYGLLVENPKTGERRHIWYGGLSDHIAEIEQLKVELAKANDLIQEIDKTLRVPAAEYVPVIGDVFTLIDKAKKS